MNNYHDEYSQSNNNVFSESVWCPFCYGAGLRRIRSHSLDPRIEIKTCTRCKGRKRIWVKKYSSLYEKAKKIIPGVTSPGIRKHSR